MVVKYRNGELRVIIGNSLAGENSYNYLKNYTEELTDNALDAHLDIVAVYEQKEDKHFGNYFDDLGEPIWTREGDRVRLTLRDIAELKGCDVSKIEIVD
jgi:hypothetical protein